MKAIVFHRYGLPDVLQLEEVAKPAPKEDEALIKVHAASVNDWDWGLLRGVPFINRLMAGFPKPKKITILGCDIAGRIEAIGKNVKQFRPGDEVFGDISKCGFGGFADYVCARENALTKKPASMTFEQAAALPQAGVLALTGLRDNGHIQPGQKVLINGASGGTGSYAVQMAKAFGAEVTGVCRTNKLEFVRSLGADHVIDFTQEDFTKNGQHYDLILDLMSFHSIFHSKHSLSPKGIYVMVGGATAIVNQVLLFGTLFSLFGKQKLGLLLLKQNKDMDVLIELFETGKIIPIIDKCYPLSETADAIRYFGEGHKKGKVAITLNQ